MISSLRAVPLALGLTLLGACDDVGGPPTPPNGTDGTADPADADNTDGTDGTDGADGPDGMDGTDGTEPPVKPPVFDELAPFASAAAFDAYVDQLGEALEAQDPPGEDDGFADAGVGAADDGSEEEPDVPSEDDDSITNNQEAGVDEGGIVKKHGEHLVVLRRGRLFSIAVTDAAGAPELTPVHVTDAYAPGSRLGTWYDEMLIHADTIVVVGFSYELGATEIGLFHIAESGEITHQRTFFLRSNDYYSSRNYASRLVDGKLVFYMPYSFLAASWSGDELELDVELPGWAAANASNAGDFTPILAKTRIYAPIQATLHPVLHTVVQCDLTLAAPDCSATAVVGPYARTFYVSPNAVYLWVAESWWDVGEEPDAETKPASRANAVVYRMPLDGGAVTAVRAFGAPVDQFSLKETDEALEVLVRAEGGGDAMWAPEVTSGTVGHVSIPRARFAAGAEMIAGATYHTLPTPAGWYFHNRFVGGALLYGTGDFWDPAAAQQLFVYPYATGGEVSEVSLSHVVERIEAMGEAAAIIGTGDDGLVFSAIELGATPRVTGQHVEPGASQGEARSHGFFFKPRDRGGILGLPVRHEGGAWSHLYYGSAGVVFLELAGGALARRGALEARASESEPFDGCQVSCTDWYGNARPIFLGDRTLALLGYELVEGALGEAGITEQARIDFSRLLEAP